MHFILIGLWTKIITKHQLFFYHSYTLKTHTNELVMNHVMSKWCYIEDMSVLIYMYIIGC